MSSGESKTLVIEKVSSQKSVGCWALVSRQTKARSCSVIVYSKRKKQMQQDWRRLTNAGQQMRISYLRPSSSPRRRYQDSRPWGAVSVGNSTDSCVGRTEKSPGASVWSSRLSKLG